jgi:hypothetical protein
MRRIFAIAAAIAIAIAATPAMAKTKKHHRTHHGYYAEPYGPGPGPSGFVSRNVSDPSIGYFPGLDYARRSGRCVVDLGYGRYEYCGW